MVIFVKNVARAKALNTLLKTCNFPSLCLHASMKQEERIKVYNDFKQNRVRIAGTAVAFYVAFARITSMCLS